ncbi:MAG: helix-turn-helix transcriptional regulator [Bacteroidetes bacterium]|nr:helix-turn-helix transcriptional regulator [Bacteroidota bacterium]
MNPYLLQKGVSKELDLFPHIIEFGLKKVQTIRLSSLPVETSQSFRLYYIWDGRYDWTIDDHSHILYPSDLALVLPGQSFGSPRSALDIGTFSWLSIDIGDAVFGPWSGLSPTDSRSIRKIFVLNTQPVAANLKEAGKLFQQLAQELHLQEIGFQTRVHQLTDALLILIARQLIQQSHSQRDFSGSFMKLEQELRKNLSHQWAVEEMAALVGLGTTAFTEKVKSYTGFSPLNYLINIRISEAIKLLKQTDHHLTDIALETGFYSSQHFSTTFKKLTGYTPSQFRKDNTDQP